MFQINVTVPGASAYADGLKADGPVNPVGFTGVRCTKALYVSRCLSKVALRGRTTLISLVALGVMRLINRCG